MVEMDNIISVIPRGRAWDKALSLNKRKDKTCSPSGGQIQDYRHSYQ